MGRQPMAETQSPLLTAAVGESRALASDDAICVYAFAQNRPAPEYPAAEIGQRLQLHSVGSVAALIGVVSIGDYSGVDGERNLSDAAWLAPRVRRHAELVNWTMQWSPVFPVPFGTFYLTFASLTAFMYAHEETIVAFLNGVADKEEWELRAGARLDGPELLDRLACSAWPDWMALSKGVRYMRACRDREALLEYGRANAASAVRDYLAQIQPLTAAVRELASGRQLDPKAGEPITRYALLVDKTNVPRLREYVRTIGASVEHVTIALSGPWPPFSFRPDLSPGN